MVGLSLSRLGLGLSPGGTLPGIDDIFIDVASGATGYLETWVPPLAGTIVSMDSPSGDADLSFNTTTGVVSTAVAFTSSEVRAIVLHAVDSFGSEVWVEVTFTAEASGAPPTYLPTVGSSPVAAYSLTKIISGYSGPVAAACATGDTSAIPSTTVDITSNANGTPNMAAAIAQFGTSFWIWKLYDQSGGGFHASSTTTSSRADITPTTSRDGAKWSGGKYTIPAGLSTSRQSTTMISLYSGVNNVTSSNNGPGILSVGAGDTTGIQLVTTSYGGLLARGNAERLSNLAICGDTTFIAIRSNATNAKFWRNAETSTATAFTGQSQSGGLIGSAYFSTFQSVECTLHHSHIIYATALSDVDIESIRTASKTFANIADKTASIILDGDSITYGALSTYGRNLGWYLEPSLTGRPYTCNMAIGGGTAAVAANNAINTGGRTAAWFTNHFRSGYAKNIYYMNWGSNDVNNAAYTDLQITNNLTTILNAAKTAGFAVVMATIIPRGFGGAKETQRLNVNQWMRDNAAGLGFTLCDYASTSISTGDGTHPVSVGGYDNMAATALPIINAALA